MDEIGGCSGRMLSLSTSAVPVASSGEGGGAALTTATGAERGGLVHSDKSN